jgi:16S rRNA G966 N2-methylase RsmD
MLNETYNIDEKKKIASEIKNIDLKTIKSEFIELQKIGENASNMSERCRIGNNIVDYYTFVQRLHTRGKYNVNYFEFIVNIDFFKQKKFIQNMITYYENVKNKSGKKNEYVVLKEVYNICISAINIIRPLVYMEIYCKYKPNTILDFCAGWGGAAVAASALNIKKYIGIELNNALKEPYSELIQFLKERSVTSVEMYFENALNIDYTKLDYDLVFTSPPYYFIQKYQNNVEYNCKKEMDEKLYIPLFTKTYDGLKKGGYYILNVNSEVYERVCIPLLGVANEIYPYKKSKRQNNYKEIVYVWYKNI